MSELISLTADIVGAHVYNNIVAIDEVPALIEAVHAALAGLGQVAEAVAATPEPAVSIRASIKPDYLVCLEDGAKVQMLKRYLFGRYGLTPDAYRAKWGLPADYPMVAPAYAARRSQIAKAIGLGRKGDEAADAVVAPPAEPVAPAGKAGGRKLGIAAAKAAAKAHLTGN
jgi:predicted transcriptional regulator